MQYSRAVLTFIETRDFTRLVGDYLDENEYAALQCRISLDPTAGVVIRGSGGLRKLRWNVEGRGKRGGVRIIYFLRLTASEVWMLTIYAKNEAEALPLRVLRKIREELDD